MEEVDKDPEEASEPANKEDKNGTSTQEAHPHQGDPGVEVSEAFMSKEKAVEESEKVIIPQRIISLQRDLPTLVTNIQTAADAKESMRRTDLENARRLRLQLLENDAKSSQEKFEEITRGWSTASQKVIPQELQEALNKQQQLCSALIEDKRKLINELQQELKIGDDRFVKDLRKHAEELDLMMERMEDQIKTLEKAYREEVAQIERAYQQESEVFLTKDQTAWERYLKELWDKELERLTQRQKEVEEYEAEINNLMLKTSDEFNTFQLEQNAKFQVAERKCQQLDATSRITQLKQTKQRGDVFLHSFNLTQMRNRVASLTTELKNLTAKLTSQDKQFTERNRLLSEQYKRNIQQYERVQKKMEHFTVADVRKYEKMWLMIEAEVKQLVERVLAIDSLICKQHLGLAWERPHMAFMERAGPNQTQKPSRSPAHQVVSQSFDTTQTLQGSQRMKDASVGSTLETESTGMEVYRTSVQSESGAQAEEGQLSMETVKKVMELLCDEAGFLLEDKLLNLLAPLEKEEQTVVKLGYILSAFGIEEKDVPRLPHFLLKYNNQQREQTEDVCVESGESSDKAEEVTSSTSHLTSDLIDPNYIVPALKSFLEQHVRSSFHHVTARDTSEDEAYWESMGNVISEDKVKLWEAAENKLKQYHAVLTEISDLIPETQSLEQQNAELRMLLQQSLQSKVNTDLETP
uniref:dynein regulatory complex protein 1 n=1 Tax=Semicossyphus pulcher TaxID=241346 RepID=UPI0037E7266B